MSKTKIIQYIHRPNVTELGMGNTHENYLLVNSSTDLSNLFPPTVEVVVEDAISGASYSLRSTGGGEFRINQMGELYRDYNVLPGDEIYFTKVESNNYSKITFSVKKCNRVVLTVSTNGTEIANIDQLEGYLKSSHHYQISIYELDEIKTLDIKFSLSKKKRSDSPSDTDYYAVNLDGEPLSKTTHYLTISDKSILVHLEKSEYNVVEFDDDIFKNKISLTIPTIEASNSCYRQYITAIKSKPFLLLAGISGTGKSRIVRELARACWDEGSEEYLSQKPRNFEMVQVKPEWHDSSELIGYESRISGKPEYIFGDFLKFIASAWEEPDVPYFLCLDEMNLAPIEQYFAEYLSVIESRKADINGIVTTDPILKTKAEQWYYDLVNNKLTKTERVKTLFLKEGICIPQNLIIVGTVNMDETTFSFSRKVLDRAMTIEMNEVNLEGGLSSRYEKIGKLKREQLVGQAVEGIDVYGKYKDICDKAITYLNVVNENLEGTPFKIAYRTRNETLLYVVNNLPYNQTEDGTELDQGYVIARALDEITNMKILSRIEGDESKVSIAFLESLELTVKKGLESIYAGPFVKNESDDAYKSISLAKLDEMKKRLASSGYTSFWS